MALEAQHQEEKTSSSNHRTHYSHSHHALPRTGEDASNSMSIVPHSSSSFLANPSVPPIQLMPEEQEEKIKMKKDPFLAMTPSTPTIQLAGHAPDIQLQPSKKKKKPRQIYINTKRVLDNVKKSNKDLHQAMKLQLHPAFDGKSRKVKSFVVKQAGQPDHTHQITLSIQLKNGLSLLNNIGGITGFGASITRRNKTTHPIHIALESHIFTDDPKLSVAEVKKVWISMLSRTFLHELVHAQILADRKTETLAASKTVVPTSVNNLSNTYKIYKDLMTTTAFQTQREAVSDYLEDLLTLDMNLKSGSAKKIVHHTMEHFHNEKLAHFISARAFNSSPIAKPTKAFLPIKSNTKIAAIYGRGELDKIVKRGKRAGGKRLPHSNYYYTKVLGKKLVPLLDAIDAYLNKKISPTPTPPKTPAKKPGKKGGKTP